MTPNQFLDSGIAVDVTVIDTVTDASGRTWLLVEEKRYAFVIANADDAAYHAGDTALLRVDLAENLV